MDLSHLGEGAAFGVGGGGHRRKGCYPSADAGCHSLEREWDNAALRRNIKRDIRLAHSLSPKIEERHARRGQKVGGEALRGTPGRSDRIRYSCAGDVGNIPGPSEAGTTLSAGLDHRGDRGPGFLFTAPRGPDEIRDVVVSSERMIVENLGPGDVPSIDVGGERLGQVAMDQLMTLRGERREPSPARRRLTVAIG